MYTARIFDMFIIAFNGWLVYANEKRAEIDPKYRKSLRLS
jgi:hypothetical protein